MGIGSTLEKEFESAGVSSVSHPYSPGAGKPGKGDFLVEYALYSIRRNVWNRIKLISV